MTAELKPCPFCGGEAKVNTLKWVGGYTATALCKNEPNFHRLDIWDEDEAKAVERITDAWNTRAERACEAKLCCDGFYRCTECGHSMLPSDNYCSDCGAKVVKE